MDNSCLSYDVSELTKLRSYLGKVLKFYLYYPKVPDIIFQCEFGWVDLFSLIRSFSIGTIYKTSSQDRLNRIVQIKSRWIIDKRNIYVFLTCSSSNRDILYHTYTRILSLISMLKLTIYFLSDPFSLMIQGSEWFGTLWYYGRTSSLELDFLGPSFFILVLLRGCSFVIPKH